MILEKVRARGHPSITSRHKTTLELTSDPGISTRADCVIGVRAEKGAGGLSEELKRHLLRGKKVLMRVVVEGEVFEFSARGSRHLTFSSATEIVIRRSAHVDDRTIAISATAAASDLPRSMVQSLRDGSNVVLEVRSC